MKFSVCISAIRSTTLRDAILSIQRQTWEDWELIVVGQGPDPTLQTIVQGFAQSDPRIRYIHLSKMGLSRARNAGMEASSGEIVAMTDDDCEAHPEWLRTLAHYFETEPRVGLVGGSLLKPKNSQSVLSTCPSIEPTERLYDPLATERKAPAGWGWVGGNFAIRRSTAECVGKFDECLGVGARFESAEDTDYKLRLEALGVPMRSTPQAIVFHTFGTRRGLRAGLRYSRGHARGNGALAAKLTLMGDSRGGRWLKMAWRESSTDWLASLQVYRLPVSLLRIWHFTRAYRECLFKYQVDAKTTLLEPIRSAKSETQ